MNTEGIAFEEYKRMLIRWKKNNDFREINIQNEVIKPLLSSICEGLDVIDVSTKGPKSLLHDYCQYCGTYKDKNNKEKPTTPDLIVAQNWNWRNIENHVKYYFSVEVKSPFLRDSIYDKNTYSQYMMQKIWRHLSAKNVSQVILTDGFKWEFYSEGQKKPKVFEIYKDSSGQAQWYPKVFERLKQHIQKNLIE